MFLLLFLCVCNLLQLLLIIACICGNKLHECSFPWKPLEGVASAGIRVADPCELPDVGAGKSR